MTTSVLAGKKSSSIPGFDALSSFLMKASGFVLNEEKQYLVESKVMPIVSREKLSGLAELVGLLDRGSKPALAEEVIQAMTVNETYFFRDKTPFEKFRDIMLPKVIARHPPHKPIRIWSAACSAGQEPYSLAMIAAEAKSRLAGRKVEIIATDISEKILSKAKAGLYTSFDVQRGLPENYMKSYFKPAGSLWQINDDIRNYVTFKKFNLLEDYASFGTFDIIFCRNVLIYFDVARKKDIVSRFEKAMAPEGYLVLGSAESLLGFNSSFSADQAHQFFVLGRRSGQ